MNELQIRLTADITALTSALAKAKKALKDFQETGAGKSNDPLEKQVGLITALTAKMKALRVAQENAFDEKEVARFNSELEDAQKELTRLNALGRSVTANLGSTAGGFSRVARNGANANGVVLEFNRVIQDAPFGLIGIGNNIQQLAGNFSVLKSQSGSTAAALKASFGSLLTSTNLVLLGISAVTAAFTAYQLGAFDAKRGTDDLKEAQDALNKSLKETDQIAKAGFYQQILRDLGILESVTTDTGRVIRDVFSDKTAEEKLALISDRVKTATKPELEALADFLEERYQSSMRGAANATSELEKAIAEGNQKNYEEQLKLVNIQLEFYSDKTVDAEAAAKKLFKEFSKIADIKNEEVFRKWTEEADEFIERLAEIERIQNKIDQISNQILAENEKINPVSGVVENNISPGSIPVDEVADEADKLKEQKKLVDELSGAYAGLGSLIGKAFENPQFGSFLGQFIPFVAKVVAGLFAVSTANAVAGASQSSLFTGPAAIFTLPAFIATAIGLVASAFSSIGGGKGGGGGGAVASSGAPPQIFTNAQTVAPPSNQSPNYPRGNDIDFDKAQGRLFVDIEFDKLRFGLDMNAESKQSKG